MKLILKIAAVFFVCSLFVLISYYFWGEMLETLLSQEKCVAWFSQIKPYAWIIGILLLISDILLPVMATGIIAALGAVYGVWSGAAIGAAGSIGAGLIGYGAARMLGKKTVRWFASQEEIDRFKSFFDQWGAYAIIISRILPVLPEVTAILAGLSKMKFSLFFCALVVGTIPVSILFSWMGAYSGFSPGAGIVLAVLLPAAIWPFFIKMVRI